jgi:hypothetical protein
MNFIPDESPPFLSTQARVQYSGMPLIPFAATDHGGRIRRKVDRTRRDDDQRHRSRVRLRQRDDVRDGDVERSADHRGRNRLTVVELLKVDAQPGFREKAAVLCEVRLGRAVDVDRRHAQRDVVAPRRG